MRIVPSDRQTVKTGQRFGRIVVCGESFYAACGKDTAVQYVVCQCDCSEVRAVRTKTLRSGDTTSCGCFRKEVCSDKGKRQTGERASNFRHGGASTRLHSVWVQMRGRCTNQNHKGYRYWGGKGVRVCDEWQGFEAFRSWALLNGYREGLSLDRIDSSGNYEPTNCRWLTKAENCRRSAIDRWNKAS